MVTAGLALSCGSDPYGPDNGGNGNGNGNGDGPAATVTMTAGAAFNPATVTINVGESIRWVSVGEHSTTADPALAQNAANVQLPAGASTWNSGILNNGGDFEMAFTVAGQYRYFCLPHEVSDNMVGEITVQAGG